MNALADASPGFVWRLQDESGNAMDIGYSPDPLLAVNMSVWTDADALFDFVYRSAHTPVIARRRDYFQARGQRVSGALVDSGRYDPHGQRRRSVAALAARPLRPVPAGVHLQGAFFPVRTRAVLPPVDMGPDPWCMGNA